MKYEYEVVSIARLFADEDVERHRYDLMCFALKEKEGEIIVLWPPYWTKNRSGNRAFGQ